MYVYLYPTSLRHTVRSPNSILALTEKVIDNVGKLTLKDNKYSIINKCSLAQRQRCSKENFKVYEDGFVAVAFSWH